MKNPWASNDIVDKQNDECQNTLQEDKSNLLVHVASLPLAPNTGIMSFLGIGSVVSAYAIEAIISKVLRAIKS
jgi:hypothetical protein